MSDQGVVYVAHVPERYQTVQQDQAKVRSDLYDNVRRPTRGIQLKNESFATMRLFRGNGEAIPLVNAGSRDQQALVPASYNGMKASNVYSNFFIQQVEDARVEKSQIVQTFGEAYIFLYGEQPRILNIAGALLNTFDFNWEAEWWWNYDNYLRGTKCVENDARVFITVDDTMVSGYIIASTSNKNAQERNWLPFQFQLFVTSWETFSRLGDNSADQEGRESANTYEEKRNYRPAVVRGWYTNSKAFSRITNWPTKGGAIDTGSMSFLDNVQKGMAVMQRSIGVARYYWNNVASMVGQLESSLSPSLVRIPYGWAGATAMDENDPTFRITSFETTKPVRFTTFGDNYDEYPGDRFGAHYGSADVENMNDFNMWFTTYDVRTAANRIKTSVAKAREQWKQYGLYPPNEALQATIALLKRVPFAGCVVGKAQAWAYKGAAQAAGMVSRVSGGLALASAATGYIQNTLTVVQVIPTVATAAGTAVAASAKAVVPGRSGNAPAGG